MTKRLEQLDSLRGLAAFSVVLCHCTNIPSSITASTAFHWIMNSPLAIIRAGHEAVILFFILSGFVLTLPFLKGPVPYKQFLVKRVCRIYIPYLAAILFSIVMAVVCVHRQLPELGDWFQLTWTTPFTPRLLFEHALLIGSFPTAALNTAIWSLVHEMRISIIFPLIVWLVLRYSWQRCLIIALFLSATSFVLDKGLSSAFHFSTNYIVTLHYCSMFIVGALLAKHRQFLMTRLSTVPTLARYGLLVVALLCYTYQFWAPKGVSLLFISIVVDWAITIGASIFIVSSLSSIRFTKLLTSRPVLHLGVTSYSIYLLHGTLLFALVYLCHGLIPMWGIILITITGTLLLSTVFYHAIEVPSIRLGRRLTTPTGPEVTPVERERTLV